MTPWIRVCGEPLRLWVTRIMKAVQNSGLRWFFLAVCLPQGGTASPSIASEDFRADAARLASEFSMVALDRKLGKAYDKVVKWIGPIRYGVHANHISGITTEIVARRMLSLRQLTNLDIAETRNDNPEENFFVFYLTAAEREAFVQMALAEGKKNLAVQRWTASSAACAYHLKIEAGVVKRAEVYVKAEEAIPVIVSCTEELLLRSMGIFNKADIEQSIFSENPQSALATDKDEMFIRALYSKEMVVNTPIDSATKIAEDYFREWR